tara:strand:- start:339 stop:473 length:135 start_codon:yes stop_codon:yes gene_type:complete
MENKTECNTCGVVDNHDCEVWTRSKTLILCDQCFFEERYENGKN